MSAETFTPPQNSSGSSRGIFTGCLISLGILIVVIVLGGSFLITFCANNLDTQNLNVSNVSNIQQKNNISKTLLEGDINSQQTLAVINVEGVITSGNSTHGVAGSDSIVRLLNYAANDSSISGIILRVNSPGGEVTASDIIYDTIIRIKEQSKKPVVVMMETLAASGGYYISCPADWIVANPTTWTGSIGVIIAGINFEEGMNKLGIRNQVFTSGPFKDMLSSTRSMRPDEREYIQHMVDSTYDRFVSIVSTGRNIDRKKLEESHAIDGRIISGIDAQKIGLINQVGYFRDAVAKASELAEVNNPRIILLSESLGIEDLFSFLNVQAQENKNVSISLGGQNVLPQLKPGIPYMLPSYYATGTIHVKEGQ